MTIAELIKKLSEFDSEAIVAFVYDGPDCYTLLDIITVEKHPLHNTIVLDNNID